MEKMIDEYTEIKKEKTVKDLCREADELLKSNGCSIWGRNREEKEYNQEKFEYGMQTGAFSRNYSVGKRRK